MNIEGLNIELDQWIVKNLDELIELNEKAKKRGEPVIIPFVLIDSPEKENLTAFAIENYSEAVDTAWKYAIEQTPKQIFIIFGCDGFITHEGVRTDALLYMVYNKDGIWLKFAQRYIPKRLFRKYKKIGDLLFIGKEINP